MLLPVGIGFWVLCSVCSYRPHFLQGCGHVAMRKRMINLDAIPQLPVLHPSFLKELDITTSLTSRQVLFVLAAFHWESVQIGKSNRWMLRCACCLRRVGLWSVQLDEVLYMSCASACDGG